MHVVALTLQQGPVLEIVSQRPPESHGAGCGAGRRRGLHVWGPFSLRESSKAHSVDGECCWMPADKAEWLKTLPLFGSLSPNPNENTEGSRGQRRGRTHTPVGTRLGHAERGHLVGLGVWGFKSFGTKPKEPGHHHGSHTQGGRACRALL